MGMLWLITQTIMSTNFCKTEQLVIVLLNQTNNQFKTGGFLHAPNMQYIIYIHIFMLSTLDLDIQQVYSPNSKFSLVSQEER